jgi:hypothetical protein
MAQLTRYLEELYLGVWDDPHADEPTVLTEMVTVCPSCRSLHSLRNADDLVYCVECLWSTREREPAQVQR